MDNQIKYNEALNAFNALKERNNKSQKEIISTLNDFIDYLDTLCNNISRKTPKENYIYQWIFTNEIDEEHVEHYYKANIFAATKSLKRILKLIGNHEVTPIIRRLLTDFICDLKKYILYYDKQQNYDWLLMNTNSHITNFYYSLAENVFFYGEPRNHVQEKLALSTSTPFIIRQSIEYKVKRILGIDFIIKGGNIDQTKMEIYFAALRNNSKYYTTRKFDFNVVEMIHKWTHLYIHGGYRAKPWKTETALHYLKELFYKGETSDGSKLSYYSGVEVHETKVLELKKSTESTIKAKLGDDIEIIWQNEIEVAII